MVGRSRILTTHLSELRCRLLLILGPRPLSTTTSSASNNPEKDAAAVSVAKGSEAGAREEAYRQLHNLDFMTAAKILFTTPPKNKKFGLDFHLVQFFFACMPSLAVYLVAQYARYEIRRMEAEVEQKKKLAEDEEKAKAAESESESIEVGSDAELTKVIVRLDALEEAVKEIVDEKHKASPSNPANSQEVGNKEQAETADPRSELKAGEQTPNRREKVGGSSSPTDVPARNHKEQDRKAGNEDQSSRETKS